MNLSFGSSGVEQSPEKACVGGANPSRGTTNKIIINLSFKLALNFKIF